MHRSSGFPAQADSQRPRASVLCLAIMLFLTVPAGAADTPAEAKVLTTVRTLPVLCYHRFGPYGKKDLYSLAPKEFARQLEIIAEEGLVPITLSQLAGAWERGQSLPEKPVLITVDDGYRDFLQHARPLLEARGYPAVLFVYTDFIGSRLGLSRAELQELQTAGYDIGSHSASHPKLNKTRAKETPAARQARLRAELAGSRKKLQAWSGGEVLGLAYPYGLWDQVVAQEAQAAGYRLMFTVNPGPNQTNDAPFRLKRNMVVRGTRETTFRAMLREQPLIVTNWVPPQGEWLTGPVSWLEALLAPAHQSGILPRTVRAQLGSRVLPLTLDDQTGRLRLQLPGTGLSGTHLVVITAQAREGDHIYKHSRLVMIRPEENHTGR